MKETKTKVNNRNDILRQLRILLEPWVAETEILAELNEDTNLLSDVGVDSVGILQLVLSVEDEFNIKIKDSELDSVVFSKIDNFINLIEVKINETD
jgi:acyl carrier protein